jgi:hypothetical protein
MFRRVGTQLHLCCPNLDQNRCPKWLRLWCSKKGRSEMHAEVESSAHLACSADRISFYCNSFTASII